MPNVSEYIENIDGSVDIEFDNGQNKKYKQVVSDGTTTFTSDGVPTDKIEAAFVQFGAKLDGVTSDDAAIQSVIDWFSSTYPGKKLVFPKYLGSSFRLSTTGLNINASLLSIDFSGYNILLSNAITGLTITGSEYPPHRQAAISFENFKIIGNSTAGQRGVFHHNPTGELMGAGSSRYTLRNFSIEQVDVGEEYGNTAWGIEHWGWTIWQCTTAGIRVLAGYPDGYERPAYFGGMLGGCITGIYMTDGQLNFIGSSIDYNRIQGNITKGRVHLIGCHVETNNSRATYPANHCPWILNTTAQLRMIGGRLTCTDGTGTQMTHMFDVNTNGNANGAVFLDNVSINRVNTSSGYLAKGTGNCFSRGCTVESDAGIVLGVHETQNLLTSGDFENGFPVEDWYVSGSTPTGRLTSGSITSVVVGAAAARTGSNGLIITKASAAGASGTADLIVLKPVRDTSHQHSGRLFVKSPTSTAVLNVQFGYFNATPNVVGSEVVYTLRTANTLPITSSGNITLTTGWQEVKSSSPYARPDKSTQYVGWRIRLHNLAAGQELHLDDVEIHEW